MDTGSVRVSSGRAQSPRNAGPPSTHVAHGPNNVWTGDISWLPTQVRGMFFYLYLLVDIYTRKIVAASLIDKNRVRFVVVTNPR